MLLEVSVILHIKLACFKQTNNSNNNNDANESGNKYDKHSFNEKKT